QVETRNRLVGATEAWSAEERKQLARDFAQTQKELVDLRSQHERQEQQRAELLSHVANLEQGLRALRSETVAQQDDVSRQRLAVLERVPEERQLVDAAAEGLRSRLSELTTLKAEQHQLSQERAALLDRVTQLEQATQVRAVPADPGDESWKLQRSQ